MKKLVLSIIICSCAFGYDFYVSPDGSDSAVGAGSKDKPLASIGRAVERAAKFIEVRGYPKDGITINIAEGVYRFNDSIKIGAAFSGTEDMPIVIKPQAGANVRVVGGEQFSLGDFSKVTDPAVRLRLQADIADKVLMLNLKERGITEYGQLPLYGHSMGFLDKHTKYRSGPKAPELFFNAQPMTLARWPNEGFATVGGIVEQGDVIRAWMDDAKGGKAMDHEYVPVEKRNDPPRGFAFKFDKDRLARWTKAEDLRLYGYWYYNWSDQSIEAKVDAQAGVIRSVQPGGYGVKTGQRFYAYNLLEELDEPGEWYLDRVQGILYLIPTEINPQATLHLSLMTEPFITIDSASHITIEGIDFGYTRGSGITVKGGRNVRVVDCRIGNTGGVGIRMDGGWNHAVIGCEVFNTGSGGVFMQGGNAKELTPSGHLVENNLIHNYARIEKTYNPAISLDGVGNRAAHNEIHSGAHLAVRFSGNNHLIEFNHIYDVARETDDMAAIYAGRSWTSRGTVIRYNLIRDVTGYKSGTHRVSGVYLDDGISGNTVENNIFINVAQGLMFNGGRDNRAVGNVFINVENMMRCTNMRQAFVTWAAMSWGTLNRGIKEFPIDKEPWKSAYPNLATMLEDEPDLPKYNTIADNVRFNTPIIIGEKGINDAVVEFGTVENNVEIAIEPGVYNQVGGHFTFFIGSGVFELFPSLKEIQTEKIGRLPVTPK